MVWARAWVVALLAGCSEYGISGKVEETEDLVPAIALDPAAIDYGAVGLSDRPEVPFTVSNVGQAPLILDVLSIDGASFAFGSDPSGAEILPGQAIGGTVVFTPGDTELFGQVHVPSNDPARPDATIDLHGEPGAPGLLVEPLLIDFGYVELGFDASASLSVTNTGMWPADIVAAAPSDPVFTVDFAPFTLAPGASQTLTVTFLPVDPVAYSGELVITMAGVGDAVVDLLGTGITAPDAVCAADPPVPVLQLDTVDWLGSGSTDPAGRPLTYQWTLLSAPGGSTATLPAASGSDVLGFVPDVEGTYLAELTVTNDVGLTDTCQAQVDALDGEPVAVCSVSPNPAEALNDVVTWSGAGSYDPLGGALEYQWTLVGQPLGSSVTMPGGMLTNPDRGGFVADLVGTYTGELVVTSSVGLVSAPCLVDLEVIPSAELWVEMFWSHNGEDMDLHLVRAAGGLRTTQDCYYGNCTGGLSWLPTGPDGDPYLDLDDISGTGPENINVSAPANVTYHVWVHDYPGSVRNAATDVTVNIYLSGALVWTDTKAISGEDSDTWFADVDWATQTVIP